MIPDCAIPNCTYARGRCFGPVRQRRPESRARGLSLAPRGLILVSCGFGRRRAAASRQRSPATWPSSSAGRVGGWPRPIRGHWPSNKGRLSPSAKPNAAQTLRLLLNWGDSPVRQVHTKMSAEHQHEQFPSPRWAAQFMVGSSAMPVLFASGVSAIVTTQKTPDARFQIARFQNGPCPWSRTA